MRCRCGWYDRRRAAHCKMCDSPRSRVLSLNVRFYTESSLIRLLSVSAGFFCGFSHSRVFCCLSIPRGGMEQHLALFFVKESRIFTPMAWNGAKKAFRGCAPPKPPPICAPHNFRAIRDYFRYAEVGILLRYSHEMKFAGTWWRLSTTMQRLLRNGCFIIDFTLFKKH